MCCVRLIIPRCGIPGSNPGPAIPHVRDRPHGTAFLAFSGCGFENLVPANLNSSTDDEDEPETKNPPGTSGCTGPTPRSQTGAHGGPSLQHPHPHPVQWEDRGVGAVAVEAVIGLAKCLGSLSGLAKTEAQFHPTAHHRFPTPTALRPQAQGWSEERGLPWEYRPDEIQPQGGCGPVPTPNSGSGSPRRWPHPRCG